MTSEQLTADTIKMFIQRMRVTIEAEMPLLDKDDSYPSGAVDYFARLHFDLNEDDLDLVGVENADDRARLTAYLATGKRNDQGDVSITIASGHFVVGDTDDENLFDALDAREGDLALVAGSILDLAGGGIADGLDGIVDTTHGYGYAVIVNSVSVKPMWRGTKLGLLFTGKVLKQLGNGAACIAALYPMTPGADDRTAASAALTTYWSQLGFVRFRDDVMVYSFAEFDLEDRINALAAPNPV